MARRHLTKAIEMKPDMAFAYSKRGWVNWFERKHDLALADFDSALHLDPFIEEAWQGRALVHRDQWKLTQADADLTHVLELDPSDTLMIWLRGSIRYARGEHYEALKDFQMARDLDSNNCLYQLDLAFAMLEKGLYGLAEKSFDEMVQSGPCWHDALRGSLLCKLRSGRLEEARQFAEGHHDPQFSAWLQSIVAHEQGQISLALEQEQIALQKGRSRLGWFNYTSGLYALARGERKLAEDRLLDALKWGDFHIKQLARIEIEKGGFKIPKGMKY
jgi:tetratricopeptide (TPR) repeat protein